MSDTATTVTEPATAFARFLTYMASVSIGKIASLIFILIAIGQFIYAAIFASQYQSPGENWNLVAPQVIKIGIMTLIGSFALFVVSVLFYIQSPRYIFYFITLVLLLTMNFAYAAYAFGSVSGSVKNFSVN